MLHYLPPVAVLASPPLLITLNQGKKHYSFNMGFCKKNPRSQEPKLTSRFDSSNSFDTFRQVFANVLGGEDGFDKSRRLRVYTLTLHRAFGYQSLGAMTVEA